MTPDLLAFFTAYRDAFNALDAEAIAALYAEPSGIAQGGAYTHWPKREPVAGNMKALCELYRGKGFVSARFEEAAWLDQGDRHAVVDLQWRIDWNAGQAPWLFNTTYNVIRTGQGWRVLLCTAYTEDQLHRSSGAA